MRSGAERDGGGLEAAHFGAADFGAADALAESFQRRGGQPGIAYGIVAGGRLVHAGGFGQRRAGRRAGEVPDAGTVFRIASMTKSFTAAAMLALRDEGALRLDDLAEDYVPELPRLVLGHPGRAAGPAPPSADHDRRVPDRRSLGGPPAGLAAPGVR